MLYKCSNTYFYDIIYVLLLMVKDRKNEIKNNYYALDFQPKSMYYNNVS